LIDRLWQFEPNLKGGLAIRYAVLNEVLIKGREDSVIVEREPRRAPQNAGHAACGELDPPACPVRVLLWCCSLPFVRREFEDCRARKNWPPRRIAVRLAQAS
jgi:hypothetical protein